MHREPQVNDPAGSANDTTGKPSLVDIRETFAAWLRVPCALEIALEGKTVADYDPRLTSSPATPTLVGRDTAAKRSTPR